MTIDQSAVNPAEVPSPFRMPGATKPEKKVPGLDDAQERAKALAVKNYNTHRSPDRGRPLTSDLVYILSFTRWPTGYFAVVCSTVNRSLRWFITNTTSSEMANGKMVTTEIVSIEVYQKVHTSTEQVK